MSVNTNNIGNRFCNVWFLSQNLLLIEDRGLEEMMKTMDRPETFPKIKKIFSSSLEKKDAMHLLTGFATVSQNASIV